MTFSITLLVKATVTHCKKEEQGRERRKERGVEEKRQRVCDNDSKWKSAGPYHM